jgi:dephospho-CoA kinase
MMRIGLTGGLASGKSTIATMFMRQHGIPVCDADYLVRGLLNSDARDTVLAEFPESRTVDGSIDRTQLAKIVFADPEKRKKLEAIIHPLVGDVAREWFRMMEDEGNHFAIFDAPLLFESGLNKEMDEVIVVYVPPETQIQRAIERGMTELDAEARIAAQMPLNQRWPRNHLIINTYALDDTVKQVDAIVADWKAKEAP